MLVIEEKLELLLKWGGKLWLVFYRGRNNHLLSRKSSENCVVFKFVSIVVGCHRGLSQLFMIEVVAIAKLKKLLGG
jgi:hypothetical protein